MNDRFDLDESLSGPEIVDQANQYMQAILLASETATSVVLAKSIRNDTLRESLDIVARNLPHLSSMMTMLVHWKNETPMPMRLCCEGCGKLHIDEGEFATKPHHTHSCQFCGLTWRPATFNTVGVRFLPGFKNEP